MRAVNGSLGHSLYERCREIGGSIAGDNGSVAAEMGDDESRVGDRVRREGGGALTSHGGTQSLSCLTDRKGEGCVLLNVSEKCHRISMPWWGMELRDPHFSGA